MISAIEYIKQRKGKKVDVDGYYGAQCWDLFANFQHTAGYPITNCTQTGYANDIYNYRKSNGVLKNFKEVSTKELHVGDWIFWNKCTGGLPHVAMFVSYEGNKVKVFGQNQNGADMSACEKVISLDGVAGVLRPNCYATINKCPFKSKGTVKAKYDKIRVRRYPKVEDSNYTGLWYNKGMILNYQSIVLTNGWYWAVYKNYDGYTRYIALCDEKLSAIFWEQI